MGSMTQTTTLRRWAWNLRGVLPSGKKGWLLLLLAPIALVLITLALAQVFRPVPNSSITVGEAAAPTLEWSTMLGTLNRSIELPNQDSEAVGLDALLATPQYFAAARRQAPESALAEPSVLFYVTETTHVDDLPASLPQPALRLDNDSTMLYPAETIVMADSAHHRSTIVRFAVGDLLDPAVLSDGSTVEMIFPAVEVPSAEDQGLQWALPLQYSEDYASAGITLGAPDTGAPLPGVSGVAILAVLGGLLAAMWPCLFQLTAYFIPAMAGMSMNEVSTATGLKPRVGVVRTAFFFVLGFTIVYTLAGAIIGFGSQQLSNMGSFYVWQRYLSIGAGIILFVLAFRVAARARAPLVCKMPIASRMAHKGVTSSWESMLVGITFATGCMTCFGSAILIGMVLYVGLAGSAMVGAGLLFLFSLGMGIPLVIGAIAMAKVLPVLFKMEKIIPWMGLASATLIAGYAFLLITGNSMAVSNWFYRLMGMASPLA